MVYQTEHEIFENIKAFWNKYSNFITYSIILLLGSILFWKWWNHKVYNVLEQSSVIYNEVLNGYFSKNEKHFLANANKLMKEYDSTIYADFTRLMLANKLLETKPDEAKNHLTYIVLHSKQGSIVDIAKIRLAKIYINENKLNEALNVTANISNQSLQSYAHEIRGDVYVQTKKIDEAQKEYKLAISTKKGVDLELDKILLYKLANLSQHK